MASSPACLPAPHTEEEGELHLNSACLPAPPQAGDMMSLYLEGELHLNSSRISIGDFRKLCKEATGGGAAPGGVAAAAAAAPAPGGDAPGTGAATESQA